MNIFISIFCVSLAVLLYTYLGYPIILFFLSKIYKLVKQKHTKGCSKWPKVGILVAAYNEERVIDEKIQNSLSIDYPEELLAIWIASDGSSDKTNEIVRKYAEKNERINLLEFPRMGKSKVINRSVPYVTSDIIVFSDANTEYEPDALEKMIRYFGDEKVGCVSGRLIYRNPGEIITGKGEGLYWRYETILKKLETKIGYVAGANGAIYAIRKKLFEPLPSKTINDDFTTSMKIVEKGYKSIYEENAIAYEDVAPTMETEFKRHVRDSAGHYIAVWYLLRLLNPLLGIRSFIYWSHRILRWSAPFILILLFIINILLLDRPVFIVIFMLQLSFYLLGTAGLMTVKSKRLPFIMYIPFYFCNLNLALLLGFVRAFTGKQKTIWQSTERL